MLKPMPNRLEINGQSRQLNVRFGSEADISEFLTDVRSSPKTDMAKLMRKPPNLRRHIRYPEDLFTVQAEMYGSYQVQ
jgi:hypothetical protein